MNISRGSFEARLDDSKGEHDWVGRGRSIKRHGWGDWYGGLMGAGISFLRFLTDKNSCPPLRDQSIRSVPVLIF